MNAIMKKKIEWQEGIGDVFFIGVVIIFRCRACKKFCMMDTKNTQKRANARAVFIHTLNHGCIRIGVQGNKCECATVVRYDGLGDGIFSATIHHTFTRELLDS